MGFTESPDTNPFEHNDRRNPGWRWRMELPWLLESQQVIMESGELEGGTSDLLDLLDPKP